MVSGEQIVSYSDSPNMLVFGDSPAGRDAAKIAIQAAGGRVGAVLPIEDAITRLDEQAGLDGVAVDLVSDAGELIDRLIEHLNQAASTGCYPSVVSVAPQLVDPVFARISHPNVLLLCRPTAIERVAAVATLLAERSNRLHDLRSEQGTDRLRQLSEEVGRIARTLAVLSATEEVQEPTSFGDRRKGFRASPSTHSPAEDAAVIRSIIRGRRLREQYFDRNLFADPAWDMLLDLMAARLERQPVAVSSLCIAAAVPPTTALRWVKSLTDEGIFIRTADPRDGRRVFIELSDEAAEGMMSYLSAARRTGAASI